MPCNNRRMPGFSLRPLGRSGLEVSPICLGGNVFGWTVDEATSFRLLDAWVDAGMNFVDTADVYSRWVPGHAGGESETIIGKWFRQSGKRHRVVLATKVGKPMGDADKGLSKAYIRRAVEASLRRLQTEVIDLYQAHDDDAATPLEETLGTFAELVKEGKVRAIGASNYTGPRLALALETSRRLGVPRYESLQPLYNLVEREPYESELEPVCVENGLGVINFYALASGFLTGKYRSAADLGKSVRGSGAGKYLNERGLAVLGALDAVAATVGATPAQVALAWQIARPSITAPIASATTPAQLDGLVAAARLQLDAPSIELIDRVSRTTTS
jgi:aryl-alcohol dehydrogenase-like predicted oxidoreductase